MKSILTVLFSFVFLVSGLSQTRNVVVGTNDVIVQPTNFWSANASNGRTGLGLGSAATNPASAFQPSSAVLSNLANSNGASLTNISVSNLSGTLAVASGGTGATNAAGARTNLGLGATNDVRFNSLNIYPDGENASSISAGVDGMIFNYGTNPSFALGGGVEVVFYTPIRFLTNLNSTAVTRTNLGLGWSALTNTNAQNFYTSTLTAYSLIGPALAEDPPTAREDIQLSATWLTNTNVTNFRTAIGLGATNNVTFSFLTITNSTNNTVAKFEGPYGNQLEVLTTDEDFIAGYGGSNYAIGVDATGFKVKYSLSQTDWGAPVLVSTGGSVVSPTNFWQQAPIQTVVQNLAPITNSTNAATNARNLYVYSLATNITGVTNTVTLPTNTSTFAGDSATIIHQGPTSSVTAVRQAGSTNNLITINRFDESVKFIYENGDWTTYHNISFQEPIYFSGTNTTANAATSRTNLGLPLAALTNTNAAGFQRAIFTTNAAPTNSANVNTVNFNTAVAWIEISVVTNSVTNSYRIPVFQ